MKYRRANLKGGCYFFTVVTHKRRPHFQNPDVIELLRKSIEKVMIKYPFTINAIVVLPNHIHAIWTLPKDDNDFSLRWRLIKTFVTKHQVQTGHLNEDFWQKRFWEHQIRNESDYKNLVEYIHYNPVKHGYVNSVKEWKYSSFHQFVNKGIYGEHWSESHLENLDGVGYE